MVKQLTIILGSLLFRGRGTRHRLRNHCCVAVSPRRGHSSVGVIWSFPDDEVILANHLTDQLTTGRGAATSK